MKIKIKARILYPELFTARDFKGDGNFKYGAKFLIEKGSESDKLVQDTIKQVATEKWKEKAKAKLQGFGMSKQQMCYIDGDIDNFDGLNILSSTRKISAGRPDVRDRDTTPLAESDGKPYSGCYVVGIVDVWAQDDAGYPGIRCQLMGVQFVKDGEPLKAAPKASDDDFEDLGVEEGEDMFA